VEKQERVIVGCVRADYFDRRLIFVPLTHPTGIRNSEWGIGGKNKKEEKKSVTKFVTISVAEIIFSSTR